MLAKSARGRTKVRSTLIGAGSMTKQKRPKIDIGMITSIADRQNVSTDNQQKKKPYKASIPIAQDVEQTANARKASLEDAQLTIDHLQKEIQHRDTDLANEGRLIQKLDPALVFPSAYANRFDAAYSDEKYMTLKKSIAENGQDDPIDVRPLPDNKFEVVAGHRRHRACSELGIPVKALIMPYTDLALVKRMYRENAERADMSPIEEAVWYINCVIPSAFNGDSNAFLQDFDRTRAWLSQRRTMAQIPNDILACFSDPRKLTRDQAYQIGMACKDHLHLKFLMGKLDTIKDTVDNTGIDAAVAEIQKKSPGTKTRKQLESTKTTISVHRDKSGASYVRLGKDKKAGVIRFRVGIDEDFIQHIWKQIPELYDKWSEEKT